MQVDISIPAAAGPGHPTNVKWSGGETSVNLDSTSLKGLSDKWGIILSLLSYRTLLENSC